MQSRTVLSVLLLGLHLPAAAASPPTIKQFDFASYLGGRYAQGCDEASAVKIDTVSFVDVDRDGSEEALGRCLHMFHRYSRS